MCRGLFVVGLGVAFASPAFAQAPLPSATDPVAAPPPSRHELYVKPEHGQWMICVKSYSGPLAKGLAEELAKDIRTTYRVPAYLFERGTEERQRQDKRIAEDKAAQLLEQNAFLKMADKLREEALASGSEFVEGRPKLKVRRFEIQEQWAVLIGGWKDMESARKDLDRIRTWQAPKNTALMDSQIIARRADGKNTGESQFINPFHTGLVVPNPVAPRAVVDDGTDRIIAKLNSNEEFSVFKIRKPWTMVVKSFHPPVKVRDMDGDKSVMQRVFGEGKGQEMQATVLEAVSFAKVLRSPNFKPRPYDSYVLHTLYGTLICVGEYDGPDDPLMAQTSRELESQLFTVKKADEFASKSARLFDPMFALQIPKLK